MRPLHPLLLLLALWPLAARAHEGALDRLGQALRFSTEDNRVRGRLSGTFDLEAYHVGQPSPGLIFTEGHLLLNPRLALFVDARWGEHLYGFVQARADRGFDPNAGTDRFRWDEYALILTPGSTKALAVEAGKFATALGNWAPRHGSWNNPFVTAPLPYENVTAISDLEAPLTPAEFGPFPAEEKYEYNPIVWGASYATGVKAMGILGRFDYAVEVKNTGPASRPESWPLSRTRFAEPVYTARIGYRPDLRWNLGLSFSEGAYLLPAARPTLPANTTPGDFRQRLWVQDLAFAWHHLQLWAEFFQASFDVPRVGVARTQAGYVETKLRLSPQLYSALRLNRQVFSSPEMPGASRPWGEDLWRLDAALGFRLSPFTLLKLQASPELPDKGGARVNLAAQFSLRF